MVNVILEKPWGKNQVHPYIVLGVVSVVEPIIHPGVTGNEKSVVLAEPGLRENLQLGILLAHPRVECFGGFDYRAEPFSLHTQFLIG